ncbi:MAG: hypothetical protein Q9210_004690 [Variospora velana]
MISCSIPSYWGLSRPHPHPQNQKARQSVQWRSHGKSGRDVREEASFSWYSNCPLPLPLSRPVMPTSIG